ncbi:MAG: two component transcriptional regulator, winged helix family [Anaerosporomusa subterranea]|nr:two component transcriptional regulator, winged helix family [Anaerosporomusa subterranea]
MSGKGPQVLVINQEPREWKLLTRIFAANNYQSEIARNGAEGIQYAATHRPNIIILDLCLPDMDGLEVIRRIRQESNVPVMMLSERNKDRDKVASLDAGADDYLTKPFSADELMARIRALLRRVVVIDSRPIVTCGDLSVDLVRRYVTVGDKSVFLTPKEYLVLSALAQHPGKVVARQQLNAVLREDRTDDGHYLRVYISKLRQKLGDKKNQPRYIITESGVGYRLGYQ